MQEIKAMGKMKSLLISILIMLSFTDVYSEGEGAIKMVGWDNGFSFRMKTPKNIWVGFNGFVSSSKEDDLNSFKSRAGADTLPPLIGDGYLKTKRENFRTNLIAIYEKQVIGPIRFNPFVSVGYVFDREESHWRNQGDYPPTGNTNLNEIMASIGIEPTIRIYERLLISTKFGCRVSKLWRESNTEYFYPGDQNTYYRRSNGENISYMYFGPRTLLNAEIALHWIFK